MKKKKSPNDKHVFIPARRPSSITRIRSWSCYHRHVEKKAHRIKYSYYSHSQKAKSKKQASKYKISHKIYPKNGSGSAKKQGKKKKLLRGNNNDAQN